MFYCCLFFGLSPWRSGHDICDSAFNSKQARLLAKGHGGFSRGETMLSTGWKARAPLIAFAFSARHRKTPGRTRRVHFGTWAKFRDPSNLVYVSLDRICLRRHSPPYNLNNVVLLMNNTNTTYFCNRVLDLMTFVAWGKEKGKWQPNVH